MIQCFASELSPLVTRALLSLEWGGGGPAGDTQGMCVSAIMSSLKRMGTSRAGALSKVRSVQIACSGQMSSCVLRVETFL